MPDAYLEGLKPRDSKRRCPYCHEQLDAAGELRACPECETLQHNDCWRENTDHCAVCHIQSQALEQPVPTPCKQARCQNQALSDASFGSYRKYCLAHAEQRLQHVEQNQASPFLGLVILIPVVSLFVSLTSGSLGFGCCLFTFWGLPMAAIMFAESSNGREHGRIKAKLFILRAELEGTENSA